AWITVLAGAARSDETVLCALITLDLGVLERCPVRLLLAEAPDVLLHDLLDRNIDQFRRTWMPCNAHGTLLSIEFGIVTNLFLLCRRRQTARPYPSRRAHARSSLQDDYSTRAPQDEDGQLALALMLRSIAAGCVHKLSTDCAVLRCVSKHEGGRGRVSAE